MLWSNILLIVLYSDWYWQEDIVTEPEEGASVPVDGYAVVFKHCPNDKVENDKVERKLNRVMDKAFGEKKFLIAEAGRSLRFLVFIVWVWVWRG